MSEKKDDGYLSRGEAATLGASASMVGRGSLDLRGGRRLEEAAFARNKANELDLGEAQRRFRAIAEAHKNYGVSVNPLNPKLKRVSFPKSKLDEADLLNLGFEPVRIAIPEKGQQRFTSFRHPASNFHIHDHAGDWVMHEDAHAALPMRARLRKLTRGGKVIVTPEGVKFKVKKSATKAQDIFGGIAHIFEEGLPGGVNAVRNTFRGGPNMLDDVQRGMNATASRIIDNIPDKAKSSLADDLISARTLQNKGKLGIGVGTGLVGGALYKRYRGWKKTRDAEKMKKLSSIEYRGHTFPGYNQPIRNTSSSKHKKMVLAKKGDQVKLVRFGHRDYGHNISPERKANYLKRSAGIRDKNGNLTKDDKFSANYWARKKLWPAGEETVSEKRANLQRLKSGFETLKSRRDIAGGLGGALAGGTLGYASGYTDESGESHRVGRALAGAVLGGVAGRAVGRMSDEHMRDLHDLHMQSTAKIREAEYKYKVAQDRIANLRKDLDETNQYNQELLEQMRNLKNSPQ